MGALALAAALFRVADGAVADAADAAAPPRRHDLAAAEAHADAAETRGVRVAASAADTANTDLAVSSRALPSPPTSPSPKGRLDAESDVALRTARGLRRATARIVAAPDSPVAVARRLRAAALAGIARRARGAAARAVAAAAGANAAAAALVRLPPDVAGDDCGLREGRLCARLPLVRALPHRRPQRSGACGRRPTPRRGTVSPVRAARRRSALPDGRAVPGCALPLWRRRTWPALPRGRLSLRLRRRRTLPPACRVPCACPARRMWGRGFPRRPNLTVGVPRAPSASRPTRTRVRLWPCRHQTSTGLAPPRRRSRRLLPPPPLATPPPNEFIWR